MSIHAVWVTQQRNTPHGVQYECPWCSRMLKAKVSNSAKNPGRAFVSCSKDHGGCALFCFLDEAPNDKFRPATGQSAAKKAKVDGTQVIGPIADPPDLVAQRLAELATAIDSMRSELAVIAGYVKEATDH